jgi:hypothetical protein
MSIAITHAQSPSLNLVGATPTFTKGTIDTELLTSIIQSKQEEVKEFIFKKLVIKEFNKPCKKCKKVVTRNGIKECEKKNRCLNYYTKHLHNFTTYYYMYNVMNVLISEKNKTTMTKLLTESSTEFAYVLGLALLLQEDEDVRQKLENAGYKVKSDDKKKQKKEKDLLKLAKVTYEGNEVKYNESEHVKTFNVLIDLCYYILLKNSTAVKNMEGIFQFKETLKDEDFALWFNSDNIYIRELGIAKNNTALIALEKTVTNKINEFTGIINQVDQLVKQVDQLRKGGGSSAQVDSLITNIEYFLSSLEKKGAAPYEFEKAKARIDTLIEKVSTLSINGKGIIQKAIQALTANSTEIRAYYKNAEKIWEFYQGLRKSDFQDFTLTQDQYNALKFMLVRFIDLSKHFFKSNVVSGILNFLLENTIIEYVSNGTQVSSEATGENSKGYLHINVESLLSAIYSKFSNPARRHRWFAFVFNIGVNQALFGKYNTLGVDPATPLDQLYFASEKIGIKIRLWNWKYTRSFAPGEVFKYHGIRRRWLRPQPQFPLNDINVQLYVSGLLYNIANLKSDVDFNRPIVGGSVGFTLFNDLELNIGAAVPFTGGAFKDVNTFFNIGIDIPIFDYIAGLRNKSN